MDWAAALEALPLAEALRRSRWLYPLVNAGHILGIALLVGAVLPMDLRILRGAETGSDLRLWAVAGLVLAASCGVLLFTAQATDYVQSGWFRAKMALLALALLNAALHLAGAARGVRRATAVVSVVAWPSVLLLGRMIAYG